ncbi:unnamed protein product [Prorocentrum cordatum]|uniref:Altered inheritance of mitochondria protein 24, mitochondrial n=1 Tax=Prorocentrum cordatum TaxID=2364126 RepID=A0ABN9YG71_9DINO|nr:unnamed protein product [Polarella glacialis]
MRNHRVMERLPGQDDELCTDEEGGAVALLGVGHPRRWRVRAGLVTAAAALGLASLVLTMAPWHHGAVTADGRHRRRGQRDTKMFHSLNSNELDTSTLLTEAMIKGDLHLYVQDATIFTENDDIVILDTDGDPSASEDAVVKSVENGKVILVDPVTQSLPSNSVVIVPASSESATGSHYVREHSGANADGGNNMAFALMVWRGILLFLLLLFLIILLILCIFCMCCRKATGAAKTEDEDEKSEEPMEPTKFIFKPSDDRAVICLEAPSFDAPETGHKMQPGEIFTAVAQRLPMVFERFSTVGTKDVTLEDEVETSGMRFLKLEDGRGWVLDREPGYEMCYELFTEVDEPWKYEPAFGQMPILQAPDIAGARTGSRLHPGEKFRVCEMQAFDDGGTIFLKLAGGQGWVYDRATTNGEVLCKRILEETWVYQPAKKAPITIETHPRKEGEHTAHKILPGTRFEVEEIQAGDDDILFLKLADGRGWVFDKHPEYGELCARVA